jgi:hypothetical protein
VLMNSPMAAETYIQVGTQPNSRDLIRIRAPFFAVESLSYFHPKREVDKQDQVAYRLNFE